MWALLGSLLTICRKLKTFLCAESDECGVDLHDVGISSICGETTPSQWSVRSPVTAAPALLASSGASIVGELSVSIIHTIHIKRWNRHHVVIKGNLELFLLINLFRINSDARGPAVLVSACQFDKVSRPWVGATSPHLCLSVHCIYCSVKRRAKTYINTPLVFFGSL